MVKTKDEIMSTLKDILSERTDDAAISFIEDISDTLDSVSSPIEGEDWKKKFEENDAAWRERYKERFFDGGGDSRDGIAPEGLPDEKEDEKETVIETFDDLFKEE